MNKQLTLPQFPAIVRTFGYLDVLHVARCVGFVATVLIIWVSLRPFTDLSDPGFGDRDRGKLASTYITLGIFSVAALALTVFRHARALRSLMTPMFLLLCCWLCINTVFSHDFGLSSQRLILSCSVIAMAACLLLLPDSQEELDLWLSAAGADIPGSVLPRRDAGALAVDTHGARHARTPARRRLARPFGHKNVAAPIMAMLVFVGIYLAGRRAVIAGRRDRIAFPALFLMMAGGKSAIALCAGLRAERSGRCGKKLPAFARA